MTTPEPTGRLAWAQSLAYDAADDRAVITALARGRIGTLQAVTAVAGSGLQIIVRGGWLAVASCDDLTSAVVGSREDHYIDAVPGPAAGSREDWLWCETNPDEGLWRLRILPAGQAAQLPGIQLARITVPANANLASQMTIIGTTAELDRRLVSYTTATYEFGAGGWNWNTWGAAAGTALQSEDVTCRYGIWYRVTCEMNSVDIVQGTTQGFIGVGWRQASQPQNQTLLAQAECVPFIAVARARGARVSWCHRYMAAEPQVRRFEGRFWLEGTGLFRMGTRNGIGPHIVLTVEDLGT